MKNVKKVFAVLTVFVMVVSLGVFTVSADAAADLAALSIDLITADNEPASAVTKNLILPESSGNSSVTWWSSNTDVIANNGAVTRPLLDDAYVVLTATAGTETRDFSFKVLSQRNNVIYSDNFAYASSVNEPVTSVNSRWSQTSANDISATVKQTNGNYSLNVSKNTDAALGSGYEGVPKYTLGSPLTGKVTVSAKLSFNSTAAANYQFRFMNAAGAGSTANIVRYIQIAQPTSGKFKISCTETKGNETFSKTVKEVTQATNTYVPVQLIFDFPNQSFSFTYNSELLFRNTLEETNLSAMFFGFFRSDKSTSSFEVDNLTIVEEKDIEDLLSDASNSEKVNYLFDLFTASKLTDKTMGAITQDLNLDPGVNLNKIGASIDWSSSNTTAITDDGVVTRGAESQPVTFTAEISAGDVIRTKIFNMVVSEVDTMPYGYASNPALADDFEGGIIGNNINCVGAANSKYGWRNIQGSFQYAAANDSGTAAVLTTAEAETYSVLYFETGGYTGGQLRYITEFDFKFVPNSANTSSYIFNIGGVGLQTHVKFDFSTDALEIREIDYSDNSNPARRIMGKFSADTWMHLKIDVNMLSRTYDVHLNGERLTDKPAICSSLNSINTDSNFRNLNFRIYEGGSSLYLDNISSKVYSEDNSNANAGLNEALVSLENGTLYNGYTFPTKQNYFPENDTIGSTTATVNWSGKGITGNTLIVNDMGEAEFTVTSTKNSSAQSAVVTKKIAPMVVTGLTFIDSSGNPASGLTNGGKIEAASISGAISSEIFIIAVYDGTALYSAQTFDPHDTGVLNIDLPEDASYTYVKAFVWDKLDTMKPCSFVYQFKNDD